MYIFPFMDALYGSIFFVFLKVLSNIIIKHTIFHFSEAVCLNGALRSLLSSLCVTLQGNEGGQELPGSGEEAQLRCGQ